MKNIDDLKVFFIFPAYFSSPREVKTIMYLSKPWYAPESSMRGFEEGRKEYRHSVLHPSLI